MMLSLVLPAHNEASRLENAVKEAEKNLKNFSHEIIIAEDGSVDDTAEVAKKLAKKNKNVRAFSFKERLGRGQALGKAFSKAKGKYVGYMDVDLATDPSALKEAVKELPKFDVLTGSRYLPSSKSSRAVDRNILSQGFNLFVRMMLGSALYDHQCGFKFFKKSVALRLCKEAAARHWFWDTEVLALAQRHGYKVGEIAVKWKEKAKGSKVRVIRDSLKMGWQVIELWNRLRK